MNFLPGSAGRSEPPCRHVHKRSKRVTSPGMGARPALTPTGQKPGDAAVRHSERPGAHGPRHSRSGSSTNRARLGLFGRQLLNGATYVARVHKPHGLADHPRRETPVAPGTVIGGWGGGAGPRPPLTLHCRRERLIHGPPPRSQLPPPFSPPPPRGGCVLLSFPVSGFRLTRGN